MFTMIETATGPAWIHNSKPIWIRYYEDVNPPYWQAYRAVKKTSIGQMPWAVDNKRIGGERGFPTLEAAIEAVEALI
jgi:hypothetical protein